MVSRGFVLRVAAIGAVDAPRQPRTPSTEAAARRGRAGPRRRRGERGASKAIKKRHRNRTGPAGRTYLWYPAPARRTLRNIGAARSRTSRTELELKVEDLANHHPHTNHRARTRRASLIIFDGSCPSGNSYIRKDTTVLFGSLGTPRLFS